MENGNNLNEEELLKELKRLNIPLLVKPERSSPLLSSDEILTMLQQQSSQSNKNQQVQEILNSCNVSTSPSQPSITTATQIKGQPLQQYQNIQNVNSNRNTSSILHSDYFDIDFNMSKPHILIDHKGNYYFIDCNLKLVDRISAHPILSFFARKFNYLSFRSQIRSDFSNYKRKSPRLINRNIKEAYKKLKFYLELCPDADFQILQLLRNNIQKVNPSCPHYLIACAQYLHELACTFPDKDAVPFNLTYMCQGNFDDLVVGYHRDFANVLPKSDNALSDYTAHLSKEIYEENKKRDFTASIAYTPQHVIPPKNTSQKTVDEILAELGITPLINRSNDGPSI